MKLIKKPESILLLVLMIVGLPVPWANSQTTPAANPKVKFCATQLNRFGIPFAVNSDDQSIIEVQLYVSKDQGRSWSFVGRQTTDQQEFPFVADADGEYWFALKSLDRNRRLLPDGVTQPELVILVDTERPVLDFRIEADPAGRVLCRWKALDKNLRPETLQILYQPEGADPGAWLKVPVQLAGTARNGAYADQVGWWPETTTRSLNVRLAISDSAGNTAEAMRKVVVPPSPWRHRKQSTARPTDSANYAPAVEGRAARNVVSPAPAAVENAGTEMQLQCEDGVCKLVPRTGQGNANLAPAAQPGQGGRADHRTQASSQANRFAANSSLPLVGDPPEYAAPPVPPGMTAAELAALQTPRVTNQSQPAMPAMRPPQNKSIAWSSEPERWVPRRQSASSTTRAPDPSLVPNPYAQASETIQRSGADSSSLPAPNPSTLKTIGDQVVSESSTMGPTNQYQGLKQLPSPRSNPPVLMPNQTMSSHTGGDQQQASGINAQVPSSGFQSAGFENSQRRSVIQGQGIGENDSVRPSSTMIQNAGGSADNTGADLSDAATEMIGSKRFRLNYGIDAIDPSGVSRVDLWLTRDGRNWTSWGSDPDATSPFAVEVAEEGRYGFRIVVHSKDGLTGVGPSTGDPADIWVHIDTQAPLARITSVPYGRGEEAGRLVINFSVADPHLVLRPVTLAYSETREGPWKLIAEGVRNAGRYVWKPTTDVPDRIFLRIDARDRAGNLGVHVLDQPIDVSGLVPHGTIHGVIPVGN